MASGNIKGITIVFDGDTTKLDKALREVRNSTKGIDKELSQINKALKFNPKNTELLAQKQELLKQKIQQTEKSVKDLKNMQAQMDAKGIDSSSEEYRALQREIITTESKLKHFQSELQKTAAQASKIYQVGQAFEDTGKKIEGAGRAMAPLSRAAGVVAAGLGAVTYKAGTMADDLNTLSKQTGISTHDLQMYAAMADLVDVPVETLAKSQSRLKKSMLGASEGGSQLKYFEQLGISVTDANGNLRDSNDVFQETIKALGQMENETERDAIAMAIFGKSANELNPLIEDAGATYEKVATIMAEHGLEPVSQEELDKANEFNDAIDTIKLVFLQAVQIVGTKIAGYLVPLMEKVVDVAANIAEKIAGLDGGALAKIMGISGALAGLSPILIAIGKGMQIFGGHLKDVAKFVTKIPVLGKAFALLANPITLVVAALAGLGLAINKVGFDNFVTTAQNAITSFAEQLPGIINTIVGKIVELVPVIFDGIVTAVQAIVALLPTLIPAIVQGGIALFNGLVQAVIDIIPALIQAAVTLIQTLVDAFPTILPALLQGAVDLFMAFVQAIPIIIPQLIGAVGQLILSLVRSLPGLFSTLLTTVVRLFQGMWKSITGVFAGVGQWFQQKFSDAWQGVQKVFSGVGRFFSGVWKTITGVFSTIGTSVASAVSGAIRSGLNGALATIENIINGGISMINGAIGLINKIPGVNIGKIGRLSLPRLAEGGVLNGAQTVIAGEAGPEAIIPLDKLFAQMDRMADKMAGENNASPVVINVYGAAGQSVNELAAAVEQRIIEAQKRRRLAWQ